MRDNRAGHTDLGIVYSILAILAGLALWSTWSVLPTWGQWLAGAVFGVLLVLGGLSLGRPSGMAANAARHGLMDDLVEGSDEPDQE